jgi:predicted nucleotidyltransferase
MPVLSIAPRHLALITKILDEHVPDMEVWAYGSRINGDSHEGSDLDLVVRNSKDLDSPLRNLVELRAALSGSSLPFLVDIMDWARLPEAHRREVEKRHVPLK